MRIQILIPIALALIVILNGSLQAAAKHKEMANQYRVEFLATAPPTAQVTATVAVKDGILRMHDYGAWNEKDGWATFIKEFQAGSENNVLKIKKSGKLEWKVEDESGDRVQLKYRVEFPYAKPELKWSAGPRSTAAFFDGQGLFLLTRSLFVYNNADLNTSVCLELPDGWKASTPWPETPDKPNCFRSDSLERLMNNVIVVGTHEDNFVVFEDFKANLVFLGYQSSASKLMLPVFRSIIKSFKSLFDYGEKGRYLMVWFPDYKWETGEAYQSSYAVVTRDLPKERNRVVWANSIAHETFHYWLGARIKAKDWAGLNWFSEGVTEYFANLVLMREGIISERQFLNLMQKHITLYQNFRYRFGTPYKNYSLVEAGSHKSYYNSAIYDGGWTAAFALDVLIREATQNEKNLEDVMRVMYQEFATKNTLYTNEDIQRICNKVAGKDLSKFFDEYVYGKEMIPVESLLQRAGFDAIVTISSVHISVDEDAAADRNSIRSGIMKGD